MGRLQPIRIKAIVTGDFRYNNRTLYDNLKRNRKLWRGDIGPDECYLFVSKQQNCGWFILGDSPVSISQGTRYQRETQLLDARLWRLKDGRFDSTLLEDYANQVGLTLGRKTLAQQLADRGRLPDAPIKAKRLIIKKPARKARRG